MISGSGINENDKVAIAAKESKHGTDTLERNNCLLSECCLAALLNYIWQVP